MPAVLGVLISVVKNLLLKLVSEKLLKWLIIWGLDKVVKKTEDKWDDELLAKAKEAWSDEPKKPE